MAHRLEDDSVRYAGAENIPWRALSRIHGGQAVGSVKEAIFTSAEDRTDGQLKTIEHAVFLTDLHERRMANRSMAHGVRLSSSHGPQRVVLNGVPR